MQYILYMSFPLYALVPPHTHTHKKKQCSSGYMWNKHCWTANTPGGISARNCWSDSLPSGVEESLWSTGMYLHCALCRRHISRQNRQEAWSFTGEPWLPISLVAVCLQFSPLLSHFSLFLLFCHSSLHFFPFVSFSPYQLSLSCPIVSSVFPLFSFGAANSPVFLTRWKGERVFHQDTLRLALSN